MIGLSHRWSPSVTKPLMAMPLMLNGRLLIWQSVDGMLIICYTDLVDVILVRCLDDSIILVYISCPLYSFVGLLDGCRNINNLYLV